jgi:argininosuccinate lyase
MALWGGRFTQGPAESVAILSRSVHFDWVLAPYDIRVNIAHVRELAHAGILNDDDAQKIVIALVALGRRLRLEHSDP